MNRSPLRLLGLGFVLLAFGFLAGYGFHVRQNPAPVARPIPTPQPATALAPPQVRGLQASPDGKLVAFTGVWDEFSRAGVWIIDSKNGKARLSESPAGWQDFVTQWRGDGAALLLEREKIPRPAAEAQAGLYLSPIDRATLRAGELQSLKPDLPRGEKIITGLLAPDGRLLIKTRREPKTLFEVQNEAARRLDGAHISYGQNRPVMEKGQLVIYAVRDVPQFPSQSALFRVQNGRAQQISPGWDDLSWSYVAPSGRSLLVAREDEESDNWIWTLYAIESAKIREIKSANVPADVISVYWSRDEKRVLGAAGRKLWIVDVPSLQTRQLSARADWNADDATWLGRENAVLVAAGGELWRVAVPSGKTARVWRFPAQFWH